MSSILFKLAGRLERKWLLTKAAQKTGITNVQKFDAAYAALQTIITELANPEFNKPEYSKVIQATKNDVTKFFWMIQSKINSGEATEEWILSEGQKLFMENATKIYSLLKLIDETYRSLKLINQSVSDSIAEIIKSYNAIRNNVYSIAPPVVSNI
jgi:hypothetical protein